MDDADRSPGAGVDAEASTTPRDAGEKEMNVIIHPKKGMEAIVADEQAKRRWAKLRVAAILGGKVLTVAKEMGVPVQRMTLEVEQEEGAPSDTGHTGSSREGAGLPGAVEGGEEDTEAERRGSGSAATPSTPETPVVAPPELPHGGSPDLSGHLDGSVQGAAASPGASVSAVAAAPEGGGAGAGGAGSSDEAGSQENGDKLGMLPSKNVLGRHSHAGADPGGGARRSSFSPSTSSPPSRSSSGAERGASSPPAVGQKFRRVSTMQRMATRLSSTVKRWNRPPSSVPDDSLQGVINRTFAAKSTSVVYRDAGLPTLPGGSGSSRSLGMGSVGMGSGGAPGGELDGELEQEGMSVWMREWLTVKPSLNRLMADPESSLAARVVSWVVLLLIVVSSTTFCLETMEDFDTKAWRDAFWWAEVVSVTCFTVEYLLRLASDADRVAFVKAPLNIVDLVAIMPFYIELLAQAGSGLGDTRIIRVVRLVRVFRVLKLGGRVGKLQVVGNAVADSADMLAMLGFLLVLAVILFSSLEYFAEKGSGGYNEQFFDSIPASFWWCMVTLMTVGYGDVVPETIVGQIVAAATMIASVVILALPISVIGTNFTQQWMEFKNANKMKERSQLMIPRLQGLMVLTHLHMDVIEELVAAARDVELYAEKKANVLKGDIRMHGTVIRTLRTGQTGIEVITAMASQKRLWRSMEAVKDGVVNLEELLAFMDLVSSSKFVNVLEQARTKYKRLAAITDEGNEIIGELGGLQDDIEALRAHFSSPYTGNNIG